MFDRLIERLTEALMRWCIRRERVLNITGTGGPDDIYLIRYYLVKSKYFNVFIHQFLRSDRDDLHDHPWNFFTYLVRGAYTEHKWNEKLGREEETRRTSGGNRKTFYRKHDQALGTPWYQLMDSFQLLELKPKNRLVFRRTTDQHKVMVDHHFSYSEREFAPLTICVTGPTIRTWGFIRNDYELVTQLDAETAKAAFGDKICPALRDAEDLKVNVYKNSGRKWVEWREYLGLPPDAPGRG